MNTLFTGSHARAHPLWPAGHSMILLAAITHAQAAPLGFAEALTLAEQNAPSLSAQQAGIEAAEYSAVPAGELPDPKLFAGIENYPVSGPASGSLTEDFMTMQKIGLMQEIPNGDKRRARVDAAAAEIDRSRIMQQVERLRVRRETALAWIERYIVDRKLGLFSELEHENKLLAEAVTAQQVAGAGSITDTLLAREEEAMLADARDELVRDQSAATARLRRWTGVVVDEPLAGEPPAWPISRDILEHRLHQHPELLAYVPMAQKIDAEVREAVAMKKPDWAVELAYQHRDDEFGDMVSMQFTVDLPIFPGRRQDPQIAARRAERLRLDAERENTWREHLEMLESEIAEYEQLDRAVQRQKDLLLPLAQEKVDLIMAAYQGNRSDLMSVIEARRKLIEARLKLIELEGSRTGTAARLHYAYGEDLP